MTMQGAVNLDDTTVAVASETHGHEEHPDFRMYGVLVFLCAESMIFLGLFIAYLSFRLMAPAWHPEGTPELELLLPGSNTLILISSSSSRCIKE